MKYPPRIAAPVTWLGDLSTETQENQSNYLSSCTHEDTPSHKSARSFEFHFHLARRIGNRVQWYSLTRKSEMTTPSYMPSAHSCDTPHFKKKHTKLFLEKFNTYAKKAGLSNEECCRIIENYSQCGWSAISCLFFGWIMVDSWQLPQQYPSIL